MVTALSTLTAYIQPPFASWVGDFGGWSSDFTAAYIAANIGNAGFDCPMPLSKNGSVSYAARVAQFLYGIPITSACCQQHGYCGAQYSSDVRFIWGLPPADASTSAPFPDAGGCDLSGMDSYTERDLEAALRAAGAGAEGIRAHLRFNSAGSSNFNAGSSPVELRLPRAAAALLPARRGGVFARNPQVNGAAGDVSPLIPCAVMTSRLRAQLTPLRNQTDFIDSMQHTQAAAASLEGSLPRVDVTALGLPASASDAGPPYAPGNPANTSSGGEDDNVHETWLRPVPGGQTAFLYSLTFVYYQQYELIRGVAIAAVAVAVAAVYGAVLIVSASAAVALTTAAGVLSITTCLIGFVWTFNPSK